MSTCQRSKVIFCVCHEVWEKKKKGEEYWYKQLTIYVFHEALVLKHLK